MPELSLAQHKVQYILKGFPALYKQRQAQPFYTFDNSFYNFLFAAILFYLQRFFFIAAILFCLPNLPKLTTFNFGHCFVCENCVSSLGEITCSHSIRKKIVSRTINKGFPLYFRTVFKKKHYCVWYPAE